jgi:hypothetical protein
LACLLGPVPLGGSTGSFPLGSLLLSLLRSSQCGGFLSFKNSLLHRFLRLYDIVQRRTNKIARYMSGLSFYRNRAFTGFIISHSKD